MKGFSEDERERIREGLIAAGREQFSTFGHDRTRIADLTDEVGIAASTFYQFFDSKEALYLVILKREQSRLQNEYEAVIEDAPDVKSEVLASVEYLFEELETNPLYYRLIVEDDIRSLHLQASDAGLDQYYDEQFEMFRPQIERWTESESFRIDDPTEVINVFRLLVFTIVAKEAFDELDGTDLDNAHSTLIESLIDGLFDE